MIRGEEDIRNEKIRLDTKNTTAATPTAATRTSATPTNKNKNKNKYQCTYDKRR